ncbi:2-dehydropantoate 2-reductase [Neobacillus vireti]|uniref:2-dehydropantoate 2-reductase n=1 Tax=Neobacillus vireti LMG 21834 TaxID=1131730 RepID=A0AB94ILT1_9BACI|nr:2-dehydropantoate 2-reductase [Neobacillus vireti]ETI67972.1 2-dehydropantoate 2-reductase [Neobacillus vireti LMG 21834]KLT19433.1 2-dehydropantoate 2-reductase [Neobacillus vireti]
MKVGIIGAGSIGLLFAAYISRVFEVTIYTRTAEQAAEINRRGIILQKGSEQTISIVSALPITEWKGTEALTIIAVKQYQLQSIIEKINHLSIMPENLLFLQNGMGHLKLLTNIQAKNIFVGSVEHGALKDNSYRVNHNGVGKTNVAVFNGDGLLLQQFSTRLSEEFPIEFQEDYYEMLENKLIVNAVINPLTAILQVENGELVNNPFYFNVLKNLFREISFILNLEKQEEHLQQIISICKNTAENRSSMLKDIEANRPTEIDAILGFLLEKAARQEKRAPQLETLYYLIKGKEAERGRLS